MMTASQTLDQRLTESASRSRSSVVPVLTAICRSLHAMAAGCFLLLLGTAQGQITTPVAPGSADNGAALFTGASGFRNGGPACVSCHNIAGLGFPGGGTLGGDLTGAYEKLGPAGTRAAMQTLYFGVMIPIYTAHPVMPDEQADLAAFLEQAGSKPPPRDITLIILPASLGLAAIFIGVTGFVWRGRIRSVRRALVERARRQQGANA